MSNAHDNKKYRIWRTEIIRRDKRCLICDSIKNRTAHHIDSSAYFPEERYDVENGVCLCRFHHTMYHTSYNTSFRKKVDKKNFCNFLEMMIKISEETNCYCKDKMIEFKAKLED